MQMIVTNRVENIIQAATIEIIKTVMAYSLLIPSISNLLLGEIALPGAKLSKNIGQLRRSGDHAVQNCLDP